MWQEQVGMLLAASIVRLFFCIYTVGIKVPGGLYVPNLVIGATFGRAFGIVMKHLYLTHPDLFFFSGCVSQDCVVPGVYAVIGAAAMLGGVTKLTGNNGIQQRERQFYCCCYCFPFFLQRSGIGGDYD
jgi:chloride channel 3/4/5